MKSGCRCIFIIRLYVILRNLSALNYGKMSSCVYTGLKECA